MSHQYRFVVHGDAEFSGTVHLFGAKGQKLDVEVSDGVPELSEEGAAFIEENVVPNEPALNMGIVIRDLSKWDYKNGVFSPRPIAPLKNEPIKEEIIERKTPSNKKA